MNYEGCSMEQMAGKMHGEHIYGDGYWLEHTPQSAN